MKNKISTKNGIDSDSDVNIRFAHIRQYMNIVFMQRIIDDYLHKKGAL